jgi:hypothetical protein
LTEGYRYSYQSVTLRASRGVDEMNAFTQPRQNALLKEMQPDGVLGGTDA